MNNQQKPC